MVDESYVKTHKEELLKKYVDTLLYKVNWFSFKSDNDNLIDDYVYKKSMIVDISFACELLIKILLLRKGFNLDTIKDNGHNLGFIFSMLEISEQDSIKSLVNNPDFDSIISNPTNALAYERRYITEDITGNPNYEFICDLCKALYKYVNEKDLEFDIHVSNMSDADYDSIDKDSNRDLLFEKQMSFLNMKINDFYFSNREKLMETSNMDYILRNMISCDMALFSELLFKRYAVIDKATHEYKNLIKRTEDAVRFMFEKGIYSEFETNRDDRYSLYYSEDSFMYPDSFSSVTSPERQAILRKLDGIFKNSRYCSLFYFDKYDEMNKFYQISQGIFVFLNENKDNADKLMRFRTIANYNWYGFTVEEILNTDIDYLEKLHAIFEKHYSQYSILYYRNLINIDKSNQEKVLELLDNNFEKYFPLFSEINDNTLDYFTLDTTFVDSISDYYFDTIKNKSISFTKLLNRNISEIGFDYVYQLVNIHVLRDFPHLIANIINSGKQYDIERIVTVLLAILNNNFNMIVKDNLCNNISIILNYPDEKIGYVVAMMKMVLSVYPFNYGNFSIKEYGFLDRPYRDVEDLIRIFKEYSNFISVDSYFSYVNEADPLYLRLLENNGFLVKNAHTIDISLLNNKNTVLKVLDYLNYYPMFPMNKLILFTGDLDIDEIYRVISNNNGIYGESLNDFDMISTINDRMNVLSVVLAGYPEFLVHDFVANIPFELVDNEGFGLKQIVKSNKFFEIFHSYDVNEKQSIVDYFTSVFMAYNKGVLHDDFNRFLDLGILVLYREHPELLSKVTPKDQSYYTATTINTLYERIKSGQLTDSEGTVIKDYDVDTLVDLFLDNIKFSAESVARIDGLLSNKNIVKNMSPVIMANGVKERLVNAAKEVKGIELIGKINSSNSIPCTIYDIVADLYDYFNPSDVSYQIVKNYLLLLNNHYTSDKSSRLLIEQHVSKLLPGIIGDRGYVYVYLVKVIKKYLESNPSKFESVLKDLTMFFDCGLDRDSLSLFVNQDIAESIEESYSYIMYYGEDKNPYYGYQVVGKEKDLSIKEKALRKLELLKRFVMRKYNKVASSVFPYFNELYGVKKELLSIKRFFLRISKINKIRFNKVERSINKAMEDEGYGRGK